MQERYSIGELSREFQITTRAIRFYEDAGLLAPTRNGKHRVYKPRDRTRLKLILRGKRLGFALSEVSELLDLYDGPEGESAQLERFIAKITEHRSVLLSQRREIDTVLAEMDALAQQCQTLLKSDNHAER